MREIVVRIQRLIGQGIQGFSMRPRTRLVGTPRNIRGISRTGDRAAMVTDRVTVQLSAAMSHALLPTPTTSTSFATKGDGTR